MKSWKYFIRLKTRQGSSNQMITLTYPGPSDEQYEQLLEILKNRLEDGLGECVYEVKKRFFLSFMPIFLR